MRNNPQKTPYDVRFRIFLRRIVGVSRLKPKEKYLYKVMDGVPFQDLETTLLMTEIKNKATSNGKTEPMSKSGKS